MRIDPMNVVVGIGAGGVDDLLEWNDENSNRTEPFQTATDWGRLGITTLAYLGQAMNIFPAMAAALAQSETPLFTKSVIKAVRSYAGQGGGVTGAGRAATMTAERPASPGRRVSWRPKAIE